MREYVTTKRTMKTETETKIVKIAHIADVHLRNAQYGSHSRADDFVLGMLNDIDKAAEMGIRHMIVAGDLLDTVNPGTRVCITELDAIQARAVERDITLYTISGNHDRAVPSWVSRFGSEGPGFVDINNRTVDMDGVRVHGVPYMHDSEMRELLPELPEAEVLVWHAALKDFAGFPVENAMTVQEFADTGKWQLLAMGDIHKYGSVTAEGPGGYEMLAVYPGSTELCSAAEEDTKCMVVHTFHDGWCDGEMRLDRSERVNFPTRRVQRFTVKTEEELDEAVGRFADDALIFVRYADNVPGALMRLRAAVKGTALLVPTSFVAGTENCDMPEYGLDCGSPEEYLEHVLPQLADSPEQAARIAGLCRAVITGNGDLVSEIEAYCESNK